MVAIDEPLHQLDHLRDVPGSAWLVGGRKATEDLIGAAERPLISHGEIPVGNVVMACVVDDLVVNVGDVADERHVVAPHDEPAAKDVEGDSAADMPHMRRGLDRGPAEVDADPAGNDGDEFAGGPRCGVIQG